MGKSYQRAKGQTAVTISLSFDLLEKIDRLAAADGRKRSPCIVRLLEQYANDLLISLPADMLLRIDALAKADHRSRESWIVKTLENELAGGEAPKARALPCPPNEKMPRQAIPAGTARPSSPPGVSTQSLNEDPPAPAPPAAPKKGQPHPKSTRGIRRVNRPPEGGSK